jgi:hypothetical protein
VFGIWSVDHSARYRNDIVTQVSKKTLTSSRVLIINGHAEEKLEKQSQLLKPILMKKLMKKNYLLTSLVAGSIIFGTGNALAQISTIEGLEPITSSTAIPGQSVTATITEILSQPGLSGGHTYTGWSFLINDGTGSADVFVSASALSTLDPSYTPTVGDSISLSGSYAPFHQIPELETLTAFSYNSSGNAVPAASVFTIPQLNQNTLPLNEAGYYIEMQNVTISGTPSTFPNYAGGNVSYTVTDGSANSMVLYDWVTSYSTAAAMGGNPVPTGPVNIYGFDSVFGGTSPEFTPILIQLVPEPATLGLCGGGALMALIFRLRRKA